MANPSDVEARLTALEIRMDRVAIDAAAARHLAAAHDADLADLPIKIDANRAAINALGLQTAAGFARVDKGFARVDERFARVDERFARVDERFAQVDERFDQVDERFDRVDERFDGLDRRVDRLEDKVDAGFADTARGFAEMRAKLDQTAAGMQQIVTLLSRPDDRP